jgi:alkylhydroperoxidase family enzyme
VTSPELTTWLPPPADDAPATDLLALLPAGYDELRALYAGLFDAGVDPVTLELCRLRMSAIIRSAADPGPRDPRAVAAGLDDELVSALPDWPTSELFSPARRAALGFAEQYVLDPHGFTDAEAAGMHEHFTPEQLATLTTAVATFDALTRVRALLTVDAGHTDLPVRRATFGAALMSKGT